VGIFELFAGGWVGQKLQKFLNEKPDLKGNAQKNKIANC